LAEEFGERKAMEATDQRTTRLVSQTALSAGRNQTASERRHTSGKGKRESSDGSGSRVTRTEGVSLEPDTVALNIKRISRAGLLRSTKQKNNK